VLWLILIGVHVLVYLKRALLSSTQEVSVSSRPHVRGARVRTYLLAAAVGAGIVLGAVTLPVQHDWLHLHHNHDRGARGEDG
jgi:hypothetical protein